MVEQRKKMEATKRKRIKPTVRWGESATLDLIIKVAECVMDSPDSFEKPTAQKFYERLAKDSSRLHGMPWKCMREKMRRCRASYIAANASQQRTCDGLLEKSDGESVVECMQRKCPHYDELHQIFGQRMSIKSNEFSCNEYDQSPITDPLPIFPPEVESRFSYDNDHSLSSSCGDANQTPEESPETFVSCPSCDYSAQAHDYKLKSDQTSNSTLTLLMKVQKGKLQLERKKLHLELQKFEWQKEKEQQELKLKEKRDMLEIETQLKIKQLELEQKERLRKYVIHLKYKNKQQRI